MQVAKAAILIALVAGAGGCSSKFETYHGPEVTRVVVQKSARRMYLLHEENVLKAYKVDLGFAPQGDKKVEGDGKTPEGNYTIDRRNPNSDFYLSIGISYPNEQDIAEARALGQLPGGDIFIHGGRRRTDSRKPDWTYGCISVSNREMKTVYAMVNDGTPITITP